MTSLSLCQFVLRIEFQVKNHFSSELKGITLVVSTFQGSMPHFLPVYSPLVFFLQVLIVQSVQLLSGVRLFVTPWTAARQSSLFITNSETLLKLMSIESVMPPNHFILCRPLLLWPSIFPSIRVFSNESVLRIRWPKYWSFSFSISPSNGYSGLISFRTDLLAVQGTLKSLLQYYSLKASILRCLASL